MDRKEPVRPFSVTLLRGNIEAARTGEKAGSSGATRATSAETIAREVEKGKQVGRSEENYPVAVFNFSAMICHSLICAFFTSLLQ